MRIRIKELVEKAGTTKISVSRKLDVTTKTLRNWDSGKKMPSMANIEMIIKIFKCNPQDLFEF